GDQAPALDLFAAVNARGPGVALSLHRHLGGLADDEGGRGPLRVIAGVERGGHVARLAGARTGQRRHDDAVPQVVAPDLDRLKQQFCSRLGFGARWRGGSYGYGHEPSFALANRRPVNEWVAPSAAVKPSRPALILLDLV